MIVPKDDGSCSESYIRFHLVSIALKLLALIVLGLLPSARDECARRNQTGIRLDRGSNQWGLRGFSFH